MSRTGAPISLLNVIKYIRRQKGAHVSVLALSGGVLADEFEAVADEIFYYNSKKSFTDKIINRIIKIDKRLSEVIQSHKKRAFNIVLANTIVSAPILNHLLENISLKSILWIHEHDYSINHFYPNLINSSIIHRVDKVLAVSEYSKKLLVDKYNFNSDSIEIVGECIEVLSHKQNHEYGVPPIFERNFRYVGGCGLTSWRKGIDLFIQLALYTQVNYPEENIKFIWIGEITHGTKLMLDYELPRLELKNIIFTGQVSNPADYLNQLSVFTLTSREDPFPLVAIEAAALSKPIICFDESGGMVEFVNKGAGIVVPYTDVKQMSDSIIQLLENTVLRNRIGYRAKQLAFEFEGDKPAIHIWKIMNQTTA